VVFISSIYFRPGGFRKTKFNPVLKRHDQKIWLGDGPGDQSKLALITAAVATAKDEDADCFEFNQLTLSLWGFRFKSLMVKRGTTKKKGHRGFMTLRMGMMMVMMSSHVIQFLRDTG
jgi:hypothetical protein